MSKNNLGFDYIPELDIYFREIQNIRKLSRNEERQLSDRIKLNGDKDAINKLVYHNLRFVVNLAKNYRNSGVPFADIISSGNEGLFRAAAKFDASVGVKFISYAVWWIKNAINECIEQYQRINETVDIDEYVINSEREKEEQFDLINEDFEEKITTLQSRNDAIKDLMSVLKEREIKILTLFFGLGEERREMTLDEVGAAMNLSNERVRQIKDVALTKLKCKALLYSKEDFELFKSL